MRIYIHVPFCARRCSYCDFAIAVRREAPSRAFADAIAAEWRRRRTSPVWTASPRVESIYLGGGTPSRLAPGTLRDLLEIIRTEQEIAPGAETTLEANPEDVTPGLADAWLEAGVNRISLGAQSFAPRVLEWMHRTHSADQIGLAVRTLRRAGVRNLSLDLIYGLPESLEPVWSDELDRAIGLEPDHLSFYALTVEPRTPLGRWTARGEVIPATADRAADEFLLAHERLAQAGFEHYEVSNAARPGFRAGHNAGYWNREPFLGLGPSAHSGWGPTRWWNLREWEAYRRAVARGEDPEEAREELSPEQVRLEERYLGLRTDAGLPEDVIPDVVRSGWSSAGWAETAAGRVRLTARGWLLIDALVASLPDDS